MPWGPGSVAIELPIRVTERGTSSNLPYIERLTLMALLIPSTNIMSFLMVTSGRYEWAR